MVDIVEQLEVSLEQQHALNKGRGSDIQLPSQKEYCPPLDTALFFALISDYDLREISSISELRSTLDSLKASAEVEEQTPFDPSGNANFQGDDNIQESHDRFQSWNGDELPRSDTDFTSASQSTASGSINSGANSENEKWNGYASDGPYENLSTPEKEAVLEEMFPGLKNFDIQHALKKSRHGFDRLIEELLNREFLGENVAGDVEGQAIPKGIDGFLNENDTQKSRRAKGKKRRKANSPSVKLTPAYSPPNLPTAGAAIPAPLARNRLSATISESSALALAANYAVVSEEASAKASAAHRKSNSKSRMGAAASYYSSLSRDASASMSYYSSVAADARVANQSSSTEIDLHGVSVQDAIRIARQRVTAWWEDGACEWAREGRAQGDAGYRIITGIGNHSQNGKGKLGPAVGFMLMKEGWRVEVGRGDLLVRGKARK